MRRDILMLIESAIVIMALLGLAWRSGGTAAAPAPAAVPGPGDAPGLLSWCVGNASHYRPLDGPYDDEAKAWFVYKTISSLPPEEKATLRCMGLARLYMGCAGSLGVETRIVTGFMLSTEMAGPFPGGMLYRNETHAWDQVLLSGEWRNVDAGLDERMAGLVFTGDPAASHMVHFKPMSWVSFEHANGTTDKLFDGYIHLGAGWQETFDNHAWVDGSGRWLAFRDGAIVHA